MKTAALLARAGLNDGIGGSTASVATLAVGLTLGLLAFAPLGASAAQHGIPAAFVSLTLGALLYAWLGRSAMPTGGPSSATALILAAFLVELARDPQLSLDRPQGLITLLAAAALAVVLMGVAQVALAALGLGKLAKFVPQPVLAGFMNGVAVLIVLSQLPTLLGLSVGSSLSDVWRSPSVIQLGTLTVGLATALTTWVVGRRWPRAPAPLFGLAGGLLLYALLRTLAPALPLGAVVGPLPQQLPLPELPLRLLDPAVAGFLLRHADELLSAALLLALISSLETVLGLLALDQQLNTRVDAGRELRALGLANIAAGLFGGLPVTFQRARAQATLQAGGRGRRAAVAGGLVFVLLFWLCGPWLGLLPTTVLAGMMLTIAAALFDRWTRQLLAQYRHGERSTELRDSLVVVALVCAATVWQGFAAGVGLGLVLALLVFIRQMNRTLLRGRFSAVERPSRRLYAATHQPLLRTVRARITLLELEGALFFGSAERLADEAEALPSDCRCLVLDCQRISAIDESGAVLLNLLLARLERRGIMLMLAGIDAARGHGPRLRAFGGPGGFRAAGRQPWFPDADRAVEAAERCLLVEAGAVLDGAVVALEDCGLMQDLTQSQRTLLRERMPSLRLPAGACLFGQGDAADALYVLTEGSITVLNAQGQRYLSFSAGLMLGETAMLDGGGRSASAHADSAVILHRLSREALDELTAAHPELGALLYRNIALHLSRRLRAAQ